MRAGWIESVLKFLCMALFIGVGVSLHFVFSEFYDFETYARLSERQELAEAVGVFNYFEALSLFFLWLVPYTLGIPGSWYLITLSATALAAMLYSTRSRYLSQLLTISILVFYYGNTILFSQYKMLLMVAVLYLLIGQSIGKQLTAILFHLQALPFVLARSAKHVLWMTVVAVIFIYFLPTLYNFRDFYVFGKLITYGQEEHSLSVGLIVYFVIFFSALITGKAKFLKDPLSAPFLIGGALGLIFFSFPVVHGRMVSLAILLAPITVHRYIGRGLMLILTLLFAAVGAARAIFGI